MKKCTKCGKDVVSFQNKSKRCQPCRTAAHRDYCQRVGYHKKRYAKESVAERERHLVKKYGVTLVVYDAMLKAQNGCCAICGKTQSKAFDVDHCHVTGKVRGLLCSTCNRLIGYAKDDPRILQAALRYIVPQVAAEFIKAIM